MLRVLEMPPQSWSGVSLMPHKGIRAHSRTLADKKRTSDDLEPYSPGNVLGRSVVDGAAVAAVVGDTGVDEELAEIAPEEEEADAVPEETSVGKGVRGYGLACMVSADRGGVFECEPPLDRLTVLRDATTVWAEIVAMWRVGSDYD
ncbi:hypothetical protein BGX29_009278 [Mortierella sp. GBA35]|nr:hypothetical protein BGX29_009278 [Mortierella sp. GBA35]